MSAEYVWSNNIGAARTNHPAAARNMWRAGEEAQGAWNAGQRTISGKNMPPMVSRRQEQSRDAWYDITRRQARNSQ